MKSIFRAQHINATQPPWFVLFIILFIYIYIKEHLTKNEETLKTPLSLQIMIISFVVWLMRILIQRITYKKINTLLHNSNQKRVIKNNLIPLYKYFFQ